MDWGGCGCGWVGVGVMWEMDAGYGACEDRLCGKGGCEEEN